MKIKLLSLCFSIAAIALPANGFANDSEAEFAVGGLKLKANQDISLDSEDLYISADLVRVKYKFTNHSSKEQKILVSFPLPAIPYDVDKEYWEDANYPDYNDLQFKTIFNGAPLNLSQEIIAKFNGQDVTQRIKSIGLPIDWVGQLELITEKLSKTDPAIVKKLIADKMVKYDKNAYYKYVPLWSAQTNIIREQVFPANKSVEVIHTYKPLAGGSVGGGLSKASREYKDSFFKEFTQKKYCIDKQFLDAFDARENSNPKKDDETMTFYSETWLGYVLSSGANWKGPIKDFRLVVDKGAPDKLISFCMSGVKKISPTQFEVKKKNFEPKNDLNILIVNWGSPE